jgi:methylated-DNA-[protein]-cysteine S-methyltransferase
MTTPLHDPPVIRLDQTDADTQATMNKSKTALKIQPSPDYQAKLATPFAVLGLRIEEDWLTDIEYLPLDTPTLAPQTPLAREICDQLQAYLADPCFTFDLSMHIGGTVHQRRVWHMILDIPSGTTRSYAEIAAQLHSAPRAVGQACGANRLPIIIPCHRVIAKSGGLGGFMNASDGLPLDIKRWLLRHERG